MRLRATRLAAAAAQAWRLEAPSLDLDFRGPGPIDPRITFSRASTGTYFDAAGVLQSAAIDAPRLDYDPVTLQPLGLLVEEQRTNLIRNNTMVGALAGTPGTLPTNWAANPIGLTRQIVGSGVQGGISYIDVRFSGTASASNDVQVLFEPNNGIAAVNAASYAASAWAALVGGSLANVAAVRLVCGTWASGGGFLQYFAGSDIKPGLSSTLRRSMQVVTTSNASTAYIQPGIGLSVQSGAVVDFTLRIGLPQLEAAAFATSVIPTTTTALTRSADAAHINTLSPWFNSLQYTLHYEGVCDVLTTNQVFLGVGDTFDSAAYMSRNSPWMIGSVRNAGTVQAQMLETVTPGSGSLFRQALAVQSNNFAYCYSGRAPQTDTVGDVPSSVARLAIGSSPWLSGGTSPGQQWVRRVTYYPRRLSNAELQAITA